MDWLSYFTQLSPTISTCAPAAPADITQCELALAVALPNELRDLLQQTNGALGEYDPGLAWPIGKIRDENIAFRSNNDFSELYMPFDDLLFFGDAGNGDQFAFPIQSGSVRRTDIFVWCHEDDSRKWVAPSLKHYFEWWLDGRIEL